MDTIIYISLAVLLSCCFMAVKSRSILKSAIYLAAASAALAVVMFLLGATWAAVFEVSVCSGLITVIFISAISLSNMKKEDVQKLYDDKKRMAYLPYVLLFGGFTVVAVAITKDINLTVLAQNTMEDFQSVFWNTRSADILGQITAILIGGIAVVVLLKEEAK
ncbi:MAG: NADH-quinone oxidoreductase subunit J [Negativicutes bacterium]|nr:NADH-quinone oxidoreductase subunit J [Negativicutes bacterium]